jgi:hypothetical protein
MILFNTGDSHTCYNVVDGHASNGTWCPNLEDHYWYKLARDLGCTDIINDSKPGRSNDMMIKLIMQHCLENPNLNTFYIINITTIFRMDLTHPHSHTLHDILVPRAIARLDFETIECTLYAHLIGLMEFLKSQNKQFLIINNGKNFSDSQLPMRDCFVEYFKNESRILNWFDNARVDFQQHVTNIKPVDYVLYSWEGHDGPEAHQKYYEMLKSKLIKLDNI